MDDHRDGVTADNTYLEYVAGTVWTDQHDQSVI